MRESEAKNMSYLSAVNKGRDEREMKDERDEKDRWRTREIRDERDEGMRDVRCEMRAEG